MTRDLRYATATALTLAAIGSAFATRARGASVSFDTVALTGATGAALGYGPGSGPGVVFNAFTGTPSLSSNGKMAFRATVGGSGVTTANDIGIWSNGAGASLAAIAREGATGPGPNLGAGVTFLNLIHDPVINSSGTVAFTGQVAGTGVNASNDRGIFATAGAGGALGLVARAGPGGPGPNVGAGVDFVSINLEDPKLNDAGNIAFRAKVSGTGVDTSNDFGIWSNAAGSLSAVAREGSGGPGPNLGPGVNFTGVNSPAINASGAVAFSGTASGMGIWTNSGGSLQAVASEFSSTLGPNVGSGVSFFGLNFPRINSSGAVAFTAGLIGTGVNASNNRGIWSSTGAGGALVAVARTGASGPGPNLGAGVQFQNLFDPSLNDAGAVAFWAELSGAAVDGSNAFAVLTNVGGTLHAVARAGAAGPGPGLGAGIEFGGFGESPIALNNAGNVAFVASLQGAGVTTANRDGLWTDVGGSLVNVVREGDLFDVDPGAGVDLRMISDVSFGSASQTIGLTDSGVVGFELTFTDGSSGLFTAAVPEPAMIALASVILSFATTGRRRRV